jgi:acyl-CoA synthetase (AMP-forming)/AMP-acid ligase II
MSATLLDVVHERAQRHPERVAYTWLEDGEREGESCTYAELDARARDVAAALRERIAPGDRVLLLYNESLAFTVAFFGCLYAGAVPVPTAPDYVRPLAALMRLAPIVQDAQPRLVLSSGSLARMLEAAGEERARALQGLPLLDSTAVPRGGGAAWTPATVTADSPAFLQYTSGSTGTPKGVRVSHGNLLSNMAMLVDAFEASEQTVVVSWLPVFHDMGLIAQILLTAYCGCRCLLMSPVAFIQEPRRWLAAITRYRGTLSGGPNFAYDLCVRRIAPAAREGLDLSSWHTAFNGSEPIRVETLDRFGDAFAACGFDARAFAPGYGLAEATVMVSCQRPGGMRTAIVDAEALAENRVRFVAPGGPSARRLTAVGPVPDGEDIRIVDPDTCAPLEEGQIGEVWVAGPNVASGYWERQEESEAVFGGRIGDDGPYLRTGDLGFLHEGELYVTGRLKDLIIVLGRNYYPQDIERTVEASHPAVRPGCSAAFAVEGASGELVVVVAEVRPEHTGAQAEIAAAARRAVALEHGITLHDLACIAPGRIRKTTSGKIMRRAMRGEYLASFSAPLRVGRE